MSRFVPIAVVICLVSSSSWADEPKASSPLLDITPSPEVDETLFLVRKLETLAERLPSQMADKDEITAQLLALRKDLAATRKYIGAKNLDPDLGRMYETTLAITDEYGTLLANLGAIDKSFGEKKQADLGNNVVGSIKDGIDVGSALPAVTSDPWVASAVITIYSVFKVSSAFSSSEAIDAENKSVEEEKCSPTSRRFLDQEVA